jgi:hypothetical protein
LCKASFRSIERRPPTGNDDKVTVQDREQATADDGNAAAIAAAGYMDPDEAAWAAFVMDHSSILDDSEGDDD